MLFQGAVGRDDIIADLLCIRAASMPLHFVSEHVQRLQRRNDGCGFIGIDALRLEDVFDQNKTAPLRIDSDAKANRFGFEMATVEALDE